MADVLEVGRLSIGTEVDASGLKRAEADLKGQSEGIGQRVGGALKKGITAGLSGLALLLSSRVASAAKGVLGVIGRGAASLFDATALGILSLSRSVRQLSATIAEGNSQWAGFAKLMNGAATVAEKAAGVFIRVSAALTGVKLAAGAAAAAIVVAASRTAGEFVPAWNRVRTLLGDSIDDWQELRTGILDTAAAAGSDFPEAFGAMYQILSAMPQLAQEPTRALDVLRVSLEAAGTSFGSAEEAAGALTAILNAFNLQAGDAERVSSALFAAQKEGVTDFGQLASSIGTVADLASSLGLEFEDLLGILATTTDTGISTAERFTQLRSVMSAIVKPTGEAREAVEGLNIELSAEDLREAGLVGYLQQLVEVTEGNPDVLARIFPQESLALVLSLARQTDEFGEKTEGITRATDEHQKVVQKMNEEWDRQVKLLRGPLDSALAQIGLRFRSLSTESVTSLNAIIGELGRLKRVLETDISGAVERSGLSQLAREGREARLSLFQREQEEREGTRELVDLEGFRGRGPFRPGSQTLPGVGVEVSGGLSAAQERIEALNTTLRAAAAAQLAATGNVEEYQAALREAEEKVNALVLAEIERMERAGGSEADILALAEAYNVLSTRADEASGRLEAASARLASSGQTAERLREQAERWGLSIGALPDSVTTAVSELGRFETELESLREDVQLLRDAGQPIPDGAEEALAQMEARAAALRAELAQTIPTMGEVAEGLVSITQPAFVDTWVQMGEALVPLRSAMQDLADANARVTEAQAELDQARRTQDAERIAEAERALAAARTELVRQTSALAAAVEESNLPLEAQEELFRRIDEILQQAGIDLGDFVDTASTGFGQIATQVSTLVRGLASVADGLGLISDGARQAIQGLDGIIQGLRSIEQAKAATGFARTLGFAAGGAGVLGGIVSLGAGLFGEDPEEAAARQRQTEAMERLAEALDRAAASMEELGSRVADMPSEDIDLLRNFERFRGGIFDREAVLQGGDAFTRQVVRAVEDVLGTQLPDFLGPEGIEGVIAQIDAILEEARRQVQSELFGTDALGRPTGSVAAREAALRGDDVEATRIRAAGEAAEQRDRATELYAAGLITAEQYQRLLAVINGELEKAVEDAEEAARKAEEATQRRRRSIEADVTAREAALRGEGLEAQQERLREQAAAELDAARDLRDAGTISEELFQRLAAVIEGELNQALDDAAEAAQRVADGFRADVAAREAALRGDDREALQTRIEARNAEELAAAEDLLEAGTITEELFQRLANVLDGELAQALENFDQAAADAAFRQAQDLGRLNVDILRAQGRDVEALALEQQLAIEAAREAGATAQYINRLQVLHAIRLQEIQAVEASTRAIEGRTRALNAPSGFSLPDVLHRSITQGAPAVSSTTTQSFDQRRNVDVGGVVIQAAPGESGYEIWKKLKPYLQSEIDAGGYPLVFWR